METQAKKTHWERVYSTKSPDQVSWFQSYPDRSLSMIADVASTPSAAIIDIGGGASILADCLLEQGYTNITVLDISCAALAVVQERLAERSGQIHWIEGDISGNHVPLQSYDIWHDRAVFHFLTSQTDRQNYLQSAKQAIKPGGYWIMATFAKDGPEQCSDLPTMRYDADALSAELGDAFTLIRQEQESHITPAGKEQSFLYCCFRRNATI